jgi:ABC-type spermidine/putrescine transport system permease subunit I
VGIAHGNAVSPEDAQMADLSISTPLAKPRKKRRLGADDRYQIAPWLYLAPAMAALAIWVYWPLIDAFRLSLFQWNMLPNTEPQFVGWTNFANIFSLPKFWQAVRNTGIYVVGLLPLAVIIPLALAIYTHDLPSRARNIYRAIIFVPMIIAPVVAAAVWRWLLDPGHGMVNQAITGLGGEPVRFLADPSIAIWTIIVLTGWKLIGFSTLILSAANANINPSLVEAARMGNHPRYPPAAADEHRAVPCDDDHPARRAVELFLHQRADRRRSARVDHQYLLRTLGIRLFVHVGGLELGCRGHPVPRLRRTGLRAVPPHREVFLL